MAISWLHVLTATALVLSAVAAQDAGESTSLREDKEFWPVVGVRTTTIVSTFNTTVSVSCYSAVDAGTICGGKRRKRSVIDIQVLDDDVGLVDSSLSNPEEMSVRKPVVGTSERDAKNLFWMTETTSISYTATVFNTDTTVSFNYACSVDELASFMPHCGRT